MPAGQRRGGNAAEFRQTFAQGLGHCGIAKTLQAGFIQMRRLFQAQSLRHRDQSLHAQIGERFMRGLHRGGVQFQPAGVGQFDKSSGGRLQPLQVRGGEFDAFGLPLRGNGKPINAAALDGEAGPQRPWRRGTSGERPDCPDIRPPPAVPARLRPGRRENYRWRRPPKGPVRA